MPHPPWFKRRSYRHFDVPVDGRYAVKVTASGFAARHSFTPLLHFTKLTRRYRPKAKPGKIDIKQRPIMFACHRDACLLSYYSSLAAEALERWLKVKGITDNVIAYRRLGKANYDFSAEAVSFARAHAPCVALAFDVSQFFDTLNHKLLKARLKAVLGVGELSDDWHAVLKNVTRYRYVDRAELSTNPLTAPSAGPSTHGHPLIGIKQLKAAGITIHQNAFDFGIPQGSPISSTLANIYLLEFDDKVARWCRENGAFYRRYSDDILIICDPAAAPEAERIVMSAVAVELLTINPAKTEKTLLGPGHVEPAQYLGFDMRYGDAAIRASSLSRQWRKLKRATKQIEKAGRDAIAKGKADKIYTRKLRKRFSALQGVRNFSSYARRSGKALSSKTVLKQVRRLERELDRIIDDFK